MHAHAEEEEKSQWPKKLWRYDNHEKDKCV